MPDASQPPATPTADRTLRVEVRGLRAMLRDWWRLREVFRAMWTDPEPHAPGTAAPKPLTLYRPFLTRFERDALRDARHEGAAAMPTRQWLNAVRRESRDAVALRLHEAWWHGVWAADDEPGTEGLGANTMATRAATTTEANIQTAIDDVVAKWDTVVLYG